MSVLEADVKSLHIDFKRVQAWNKMLLTSLKKRIN